jgi:hypothetical protein
LIPSQWLWLVRPFLPISCSLLVPHVVPCCYMPLSRTSEGIHGIIEYLTPKYGGMYTKKELSILDLHRVQLSVRQKTPPISDLRTNLNPRTMLIRGSVITCGIWPSACLDTALRQILEGRAGVVSPWSFDWRKFMDRAVSKWKIYF